MLHKYVKYQKEFHRWLKQEDILAGSCKEWMLMQYPKVIWWHTPNEGKRTPFEQYQNLIVGSVSGIADWISTEPRMGFNGLVIEMKVVYANGSKNYLTAAQKEFLSDMRRCNMITAVVYTLEEFRELVNWYFDPTNLSITPTPKSVIFK